jgi:hypothetical protein
MPSYKIKHVDGRRSRGGTSPSWSKDGKAWRSRASLRIHLTQVYDEWLNYLRMGRDTPFPYADCVIEVLEVTSTIEINPEAHLARRMREVQDSEINATHRGRPLNSWDVSSKEAIIKARKTLGIAE